MVLKLTLKHPALHFNKSYLNGLGNRTAIYYLLKIGPDRHHDSSEDV